MPQQPGYGRGLAAIFPGAATGRFDTDSARAGGAPTMNDPSEELLATIATTDSGIALIYRSLDALVEQFYLEDAAVVLEERQIGRQVFCAGRRPLGADDDELLVAPPGLYTQPALEHDDFDRSLMLSLCVLALRLDVVRYDAWHDPLTGLYDRRSFDRLLDMAIARGNRYGWQFTLVVARPRRPQADQRHRGPPRRRRRAPRARRALPPGAAHRRRRRPHRRRRVRDDPAEHAARGGRAAASSASATPRASSAPCPAFSYGWAQIPGDATERDELIAIADERLYEAKAGARMTRTEQNERGHG